jgi:hypothetical protein
MVHRVSYIDLCQVLWIARSTTTIYLPTTYHRELAVPGSPIDNFPRLDHTNVVRAGRQVVILYHTHSAKIAYRPKAPLTA